MQLRQLEYVAAVVQHGTMRKAALALFVSESTISQQITALEIELGFQIFEKQGRLLVLSKQGAHILPELHATLQAMRIFEQKAAQIKEPEIKTIRLGITPDVAIMFLSRIFTNFRQLYPQVALEIVQDGGYTLAAQINNQQIDIGVFAVSDLVPITLDATIQIILSSDAVAIASQQHRLARKDCISKAQLMQEDIILGTNRYIMPDLLEAVLGADCKVNSIASLSNSGMSLELAQAGAGIAFVPRYMLSNQIETNPRMRGLTMLDLAPGLRFPTHHICAVSRHHQSEQVKALVQIIKDCFSQL